MFDKYGAVNGWRTSWSKHHSFERNAVSRGLFPKKCPSRSRERPFSHLGWVGDLWIAVVAVGGVFLLLAIGI